MLFSIFRDSKLKRSQENLINPYDDKEENKNMDTANLSRIDKFKAKISKFKQHELFKKKDLIVFKAKSMNKLVYSV